MSILCGVRPGITGIHPQAASAMRSGSSLRIEDTGLGAMRGRAHVCFGKDSEYHSPEALLSDRTFPLSSPSDLKTIGLKATLPRLRILEIFEKSEGRHLSA